MSLTTIRSVALAITVLLPFGANAQTSTTPTATSETPHLKPAELDQLVAPIALYPDALLAEVMMASAYPLDIVQAERWVAANRNLTGDQLKAAVAKQPWDESIKSLVATPSVLEMMSTKLDWTQKLGDAVVAQQADVMDAIQRLRAKAQANNKLSSTKEQNVSVQQVEGRQVIAIEPTDPNTVYVPYYDPGVVYGDWPYADYPPYYFGAPGYIAAGVIATGIAFGAAYALGRWAAGGRYWGGGVNWGGNNLVVNRPIGGGNNVGNRWQPRVEHRQAAGNRAGRQQLNFRGSGGQQVLKPGGGRGSSLGERHPPSNRPATGNRGSRGQHAAHTNRGGGRGGHAQAGGNRGGGAVRAGGARGAHVPAGGGGGMRGGSGGVRAGGGRAAHVRAGGSGGGMRAGGGGFRGGVGGRGGGGRGGGRRSDIRLKHDIALLGYLDNGLGFYRFSYNGSDRAYVGVLAQEVQQVTPAAVARGADGYLRVYYGKLGLKFQSYEQWMESGALIPSVQLNRY
jgi:hypothetical protein